MFSSRLKESPEYQALAMLAEDSPQVLAMRVFLVLCGVGVIVAIRYVWPESPILFAPACALVFFAPAMASFGIQKRAKHAYTTLRRNKPQEAECTVQTRGSDRGVAITLRGPDGASWQVKTKELPGHVYKMLGADKPHMAQVYFDSTAAPAVIVFDSLIILWDFRVERQADSD